MHAGKGIQKLRLISQEESMEKELWNKHWESRPGTKQWFLHMLTDRDSTGATPGGSPNLFQMGGGKGFQSEQVTPESYWTLDWPSSSLSLYVLQPENTKYVLTSFSSHSSAVVKLSNFHCRQKDYWTGLFTIIWKNAISLQRNYNMKIRHVVPGGCTWTDWRTQENTE